MALPRTSAFGSVFRSSAARTARLRSTSQTWRTAYRRSYASDHGHAKKSSDLPWMIGSVVVTVPSAAWLLQQGPKKGDHGHGEGHGEHEEHEEGEEEHKEEGGEEGNDEGSDKSKDEGEEKPKDDAEAKSDEGSKGDSAEKDDSSDDSKSEDSEKAETPPTSDDEELPEGQVKKGKGEKQKGLTRAKTETKGEKDSAKDRSGAKHPDIDNPEKSKKGEGVTETAKIHGTVDPQRNVRGPGDGEQPQKVDDKPQEKPTSVQA